MKDSTSPDPSTSRTPVGARHDDSSLFSLDALKKTEEEARQQKKTDDSGLIDLKALAVIAKDRPRQPDMAVAKVVAPPDLFAIAAPVAPMIAPPITTAAPEIDQPKPNRTGLLVAVGAAIALVAALGIFAATRGPSAPAVAAGAPAAAAPLPATAATGAPSPDEPRVAAINPGERPPPKEDPKPVVTATATAASKPVAAARGPLPKAAPKEDAPAAAPKPPADACDSACQMQRAVQKKK